MTYGKSPAAKPLKWPMRRHASARAEQKASYGYKYVLANHTQRMGKKRRATRGGMSCRIFRGNERQHSRRMSTLESANVVEAISMKKKNLS